MQKADRLPETIKIKEKAITFMELIFVCQTLCYVFYICDNVIVLWQIFLLNAIYVL